MCVGNSRLARSSIDSMPESFLRNQCNAFADSPQIMLANRLSVRYLNTHIYGSGPHQRGDISTHSWWLDISSVKTQQHDERIPILRDITNNLYVWKVIYDSSCPSANSQIYLGFISTLTKLGVSFTVFDMKAGVSSSNRKKKHKICVIHEKILNQLADSKIQMLIAQSANIIILVDVENCRRDSSFFGFRHFPPNVIQNNATVAPSCSKRLLPEAFCRLVRLQVFSNVTAADFIKYFKEISVEPKYVKVFEKSPRHQQLLPQSNEKSQDQSLIYLKAVGVSVSISSCWYQVKTTHIFNMYMYAYFCHVFLPF